MWLQGVCRRKHRYIKDILKLEKRWIERRVHCGKGQRGNFKSVGETEGVSEREKGDTNIWEKRLKGQIPD